MIALEMRIESAELQNALAYVAPGVMVRHLRTGMRQMLRDFHRDFVASSPVRLSKKRGGLGSRGQWKVRATGRTLDDLQVTIGTKSGIARVLELGATVEGKNKLLAIPLGKDQTPAGARARGAKLFARTVNGKVILFELRKGQAPLALFLLKKAIKIRPQLRFYATWERGGAHAARLQVLGERLTASLKESFGPEAVKAGGA